MRKSLAFALIGCTSLLGCGGGDGGGPNPAFVDKLPCSAATNVPRAGDHKLVLANLEIADVTEGFDFNGDGLIDNVFGNIGPLANGSISDSLAKGELVVPMELFDFPAVADDTCLKMNFYLGKYRFDDDNDSKVTTDTKGKGDCNDHEMTIRPGNPELADNGVDDDCDGLADETPGATGQPDVPSTATRDMDGDGQTVAAGDCDDRPTMGTMSKKMTGAEVCGDGFDNDCSGAADDGCTFTDGKGAIRLDPLSFNADQSAKINFQNAAVKAGLLDAGPSKFELSVPAISDFDLNLKITGTHVQGKVAASGTSVTIGTMTELAKLGGVLDLRTLDQVRGIEVSQISLRKEDSLLDAVFAGGVVVAFLPLPKKEGGKYDQQPTPDIDVDGDGLEIVCQSDPPGSTTCAAPPKGDFPVVDLCIDGDGTTVRDADMPTGMQCTDAKKGDKYRFVDGISVALNFRAVPVTFAP